MAGAQHFLAALDYPRRGERLMRGNYSPRGVQTDGFCLVDRC